MRLRAFSWSGFGLLVVGVGAVGLGCAREDAQDEGATESTDAISIGNLVDLARGTLDRSAPDPHNPWAVRDLGIGEEYRLAGEAQEFADIARLVNKFQDRSKRDSGETSASRAFHAKSHACVLGSLSIEPSKLPPTARVGLFEKAATYPTWVRFSNGVGSKQSDKKLDMRGFAVKIMGVPGKRIVSREGDATATTQDFLLANQPIAPASDVRHMMAFGEAATAASDAESILGKLEALVKAGAFLTRDENVRIVDFLANWVLPKTKEVGSLLGDEYFTGAPNALGLADGDPNTARAKAAFKLKVRTGVLRGDECTPVVTAPKPKDLAFLRNDLESHFASGKVCADVYLQLQTDGRREPIEDASVPWQSEFTKVGRVVFEKQDLDAHAAEQEKCDSFSFQPWHTIEAHRPLGNVMRARRLALPSSAAYRGATLTEPRAD